MIKDLVENAVQMVTNRKKEAIRPMAQKQAEVPCLPRLFTTVLSYVLHQNAVIDAILSTRADGDRSSDTREGLRRSLRDGSFDEKARARN